MANEKRYHTGEKGLASEAIDKWEPKNDSQYLGGMVIIGVFLLVAYAMNLWAKNKSPTAQAEVSLKVDITKELTDFKEVINDKHVDLDKRLTISEANQRHLNDKMNTYEMTINQNFAGLHKRLGKLEETLTLIAFDKKA